MPGKGGGGKNKDSEWNQINGNKRDNEIFGLDGIKNAIFGRDGDDTLHGGDMEDLLVGGNGNDILNGNDGDDRLHGGNDDDTLNGGPGNDMLQGGEGADVMNGGTGDYDVASFVEIAPTQDPNTGSFTVGLTFFPSPDPLYDYETSSGDMIVNVDEIVGTNYDDLMIGSSGNDNYVGARGMDVLIGNAGNDALYGSLDDDVIYAGNATLDPQNNVTGHGDDSGSDTLIFLRYNTDGDDSTPDPSALGDGNDVVWDFNVVNDTISFLGNEPTSPHLTWAVDGGNTVITYASNSTITLMNVVITDISDLNIVDDVDPMLFG